ncbi:hypothetical protein AKUA1202_02170 [Apilactobacillus kunkeei]|uniref:Lreu_0056 family protein n=1 Tax=Apilactobacillus kunkeei TaxID=148814 RepID=UPI00112DAA68|nr:hypothetical protein [Apilactobacillus kunkeei]UZX33428.1 hypothetical protein LDX55_01090 [Apilactobacillus kunkeei]CAI2562123.1 hypothetical protein AKUH3B209X_02090 [Apilactobacillus kunkeei]CAI2562363.1 hypothetical protein AKUA1802_02170 [Apilactobacillus kunkeei]CAI2563177.1 hypothetical protein AKUA0901_02170 [Apilactobacillus kunkeei]CAI2563221.1 hypothetical protein AKUH3B204M_02210 [Apilactobacillus kunkeei]
MKKIICMMGVLVLISTALVGCGKSKSNTSSDKPYGAGATSKKVSSTTTNSTSAQSSNSGNSKTNNDDSLNVDAKTVGMLLVLKAKIMTIDELKDFQYYYVPSNSPYAKEFVKDKDTNNYTAKGDGLADVFYKISNGNVSYHYEKVIGSEAVADATSFHKVVALKDLVKEFYGNDQQKSQIDALVAKVKIQSSAQ